jgi:hypothetical protein
MGHVGEKRRTPFAYHRESYSRWLGSWLRVRTNHIGEFWEEITWPAMPNYTGNQAILRNLLQGKNNGTVLLCYGFSQLCFKWLRNDDRSDTRRGVREDRF